MGSWAAWLSAQTKRPGWSQLRLARESGVHRTTITRWLRGDGGLTIDSVRKIAKALDVDLRVAMAAAGDLVAETDEDPNVQLIRDADLPDDIKRDLIEMAHEQRRSDERRRMEEFARLIQIARRQQRGA